MFRFGTTQRNEFTNYHETSHTKKVDLEIRNDKSNLCKPEEKLGIPILK